MRFRSASETLPKAAVVIELGPQSVLRAPLRQNRPDLKIVSLMKKKADACHTAHVAIDELWSLGVPIQWEALPVDSSLDTAEGKIAQTVPALE